MPDSRPVIGIDCRFAAGHTGLGTYTREMVKALLRREDPWSYVLFVSSESEPWVSECALNERVSFQVTPFAHYSFGEQWQLPILIRDAGCDLYYSPHFNVPILCTTPFLCTVHDLILHRYPNQASFLKRLAYRFTFGRAVRNARAIVAVSETTRQDLLHQYPGASEKTRVISPGVSSVLRRVSEERMQSVQSKYGLQKPFLLYVGNCKQHKNVPILLRAFEQADLGSIELVLVSSGRECDAMRLPEHVRRISGVDEHDFPDLYSAALACVTATLYEGFGLPMVEAMACGCPVLATNCGSIPEVCASHALLVEPTVAALAEGMRRIASDSEFRNAERLEAACAFVKKYDWLSSAEQLAGIFAHQLR